MSVIICRHVNVYFKLRGAKGYTTVICRELVSGKVSPVALDVNMLHIFTMVMGRDFKAYVACSAGSGFVMHTFS